MISKASAVGSVACGGAWFARVVWVATAICMAGLADLTQAQTPAASAAVLMQHYDGNSGANGNSWHSLALGDNGVWNVNYDRLYVKRGDGTYTNQIKVAFGDHANYMDTAGLYYQGGNVGIGTTAPQYNLSVNGIIGAKEVLVTNSGWADYVFEPGYRLRPLGELETYIKGHHHLPDIPTESDIRERGVGVGEMQAKLLAKIEELTLQLIQVDKHVSGLVQRNRELEERLNRLPGQNSNPSER